MEASPIHRLLAWAREDEEDVFEGMSSSDGDELFLNEDRARLAESELSEGNESTSYRGGHVAGAATMSDWDRVLLKGSRLPGLPGNILLHDLLTADEEQELARTIQAGVVTARDVKAAETRSGRGRIERGVTAMDILIRSNIRLVRAVVVRHEGRLEYEDAMSFGLLGLIRAAQKFEPGRGKFSTYAVWWIRQALSRGAHDTASLIRLPVHQAETNRKILRLLREAGADWSVPARRLPDSVFVEISREKYDAIRGAIQTPLSLGDASTPDVDDEWWSRIIADEDPIDGADEQLMSERIWDVLSGCVGRTPNLDFRGFDILRRRMGAFEGTPQTLDEIGKEYGITRERVRQIVNKILRDDLVREALVSFVEWDAPPIDWEEKSSQSDRRSRRQREGGGMRTTKGTNRVLRS